MSGKRAGSTVNYECKLGYVLIGEPVSYISKLLKVFRKLNILTNQYFLNSP